MSENHFVEFGPVRITREGNRVVVDGYVFLGTIVPGQTFTFLSESVTNKTDKGFGPSSRKLAGAIDLKVESIWMYGRFVDSVSRGLSARLELTGTGGDQITPNMVLIASAGEEIFAGYGIEILKREGRFYIEFDAGEIAVQIRQIEVTQAEAEKAMKSERDAYEVLITK